MLTVSQIIAANKLDRELKSQGSALRENDLPNVVSLERKRDKKLQDEARTRVLERARKLDW